MLMVTSPLARASTLGTKQIRRCLHQSSCQRPGGLTSAPGNSAPQATAMNRGSFLCYYGRRFQDVGILSSLSRTAMRKTSAILTLLVLLLAVSIACVGEQSADGVGQA